MIDQNSRFRLNWKKLTNKWTQLKLNKRGNKDMLIDFWGEQSIMEQSVRKFSKTKIMTRNWFAVHQKIRKTNMGDQTNLKS